MCFVFSFMIGDLSKNGAPVAAIFLKLTIIYIDMAMASNLVVITAFSDT